MNLEALRSVIGLVAGISTVCFLAFLVYLVINDLKQ